MGNKFNREKKEKNNKPYYMNHEGKRILSEKAEQDLKFVPKFRTGIDKNNDPIITIDNVFHCMNHNQFHAFTLSIINLAKKINPEIDYSKIFQN